VNYEELLSHVWVDPHICGGVACVRGTRIPISVILGGLAEGMTPEELMDDFPNVTRDDIRGALAYAAELAQETVWKLPVRT